MQKLKLQELGRLSEEDFQEAEKAGICVILDNVRSAHNVGAAFRSSDAFLVDQVVLRGICAKPPHKDIRKTALGATETVHWNHYANEDNSWIDELKAEGYLLVAAEQTTKSLALHNFPIDRNAKYALVFGHEVSGVSDELLAHCVNAVEIPQFGTKHSFNVSVSVGIILWHFYSKLKL
ncbi:TrmH family RNA methyltransferase [Chitinophagales bacterium]|nr:TrmH family RNA methyltransferase [Chitinophagales bacterium]